MSVTTASVPGVDPVVQRLEVPEVAASPAGPPVFQSLSRQLMEKVQIRLEARIGGLNIALGDLLRARSGDVLALDSALDDPVELVYGDQVVATGELVAVGDQFGVRIDQVRAVE